MGSTIRQHWTSMFKAKHTCNHYCQKDVAPSIFSPAPPCPHRRFPSTSATPKDRPREPKPRWSPKPEQKCILQSIFDSGMINPPREEIRKIRAQLQEYGEVGEANVFYWFQNRKSRIKYKKRLEKATSSTAAMRFVSPPMTPLSVAPTTVGITRGHNQPHSLIPAGEPGPGEFFLPDHLTPCANVDPHQTVGDNFGFLGNDVIMTTCQKDVPSNNVSNIVGQRYNYPPLFSANDVVDDELFNNSVRMPSANNLFGINRADNVTTAANCISSNPSPTKVLLGPDESAPATMRSTVFINDVPVEVGLDPVNVQEIFGDDAMLIDSSGNPVVTDDMGFSLQPLQDCAVYYLVQLSALFS